MHLCVWWPYFYKLVYKRSLNTASRTSGRNFPFFFCFCRLVNKPTVSSAIPANSNAQLKQRVLLSLAEYQGPGGRGLLPVHSLKVPILRRIGSPPIRNIVGHPQQECEYIIRIRRNHCLKRSHVIQKPLKSYFVILQWILQELRKMHPVPFYDCLKISPMWCHKGLWHNTPGQVLIPPPSRPQDVVLFLQTCKVQLSIRELKLFLSFFLAGGRKQRAKCFQPFFIWSRDSDATQDVNYIWEKDNTGLFFF